MVMMVTKRSLLLDVISIRETPTSLGAGWMADWVARLSRRLI
jgi:hypothetical protein